MPSEQVRLRTDVVLSSVMGIHPPFGEYVRSLHGNQITKQDVAVLATAAPEEPSPYSMKPLNSMLDPSEMVLPVRCGSASVARPYPTCSSISKGTLGYPHHTYLTGLSHLLRTGLESITPSV